MQQDDLSLESFLQKRKDTLKLRWVTYWFRLQNTTLFFYTQKHGSATHLRGYYYIYTMQSVREVHCDDSKRFMFEMVMTSGKRKMLAAESAALRREWVKQLWKAMQLSTSGVTHNSENIYTDVCSEVEREESLSEPCGPTKGPNDQNTAFQISKVADWDSHKQSSPEGVYDILPSRNDFQRAEPFSDKGDYDHPQPHGKPADQESPYDVPSALLRKLPNYCTDAEDGRHRKTSES